MRQIILKLILTLPLLSGCEKTELVKLDLEGTIKGEILTFNEFGNPNNDKEEIIVRLEGSQPILSITTDTAGKYELKNIPSGTYNLIISKEGYGEYQHQGIPIVGGNEPLYFNYYLIEKSNTNIDNFSLEIVNGSEIYLKGIVSNVNNSDNWNNRTLTIRYFIHNLDNPSDNHYLQTGTFSFNEENGSQLYSQIYLDKNLFSSGSKIYIVAYGCLSVETGYYDILSNRFIYTGLGKGSTVASITIP